MSLNSRNSSLLIAAVLLLLLAQQAHGRDRGFSFTQSVIQNNLNSRRSQLDTQIARNLASGKLSPAEAAQLRDKLDRLADLQLTYSEDSALNERETNHLVNGYAQVAVNMNNFLSTPGYSGYRWNSRSNRFYRNSTARALASRIDRAVVDGRITPREADRLRERYLAESLRYGAYDRRLNELSVLLDRMLTVRSANTRFRHWD